MADHASKEEIEERAAARRAIVKAITKNIEENYTHPDQLLVMAQALQTVAGDPPGPERTGVPTRVR